MASTLVSNIKTIAQNQHTEAMTMSRPPEISASKNTDQHHRLFDSGEDSDFTVNCGNRVCLGNTSSKLPSYTDTDICQEGCRGSIDLKEDDPQYASILLRYFYAHDYQIDDTGKPPLAIHARVYAIADKYGVGLLKDLAKANFANALKDTKLPHIPCFIAASATVHTSTLGSDRGLRDCVMPKMSEFRQQLRDNDDFMTLILWGLGDGGFAVDVIDAWAGLRQTRRC